MSGSAAPTSELSTCRDTIRSMTDRPLTDYVDDFLLDDHNPLHSSGVLKPWTLAALPLGARVWARAPLGLDATPNWWIKTTWLDPADDTRLSVPCWTFVPDPTCVTHSADLYDHHSPIVPVVPLDDPGLATYAYTSTIVSQNGEHVWNRVEDRWIPVIRANGGAVPENPDHRVGVIPMWLSEYVVDRLPEGSRIFSMDRPEIIYTFIGRVWYSTHRHPITTEDDHLTDLVGRLLPTIPIETAIIDALGTTRVYDTDRDVYVFQHPDGTVADILRRADAAVFGYVDEPVRVSPAMRDVGKVVDNYGAMGVVLTLLEEIPSDRVDSFLTAVDERWSHRRAAIADRDLKALTPSDGPTAEADGEFEDLLRPEDRGSRLADVLRPAPSSLRGSS